MFKKGDTPISGYTLVNFLGRGQYGEVWGATAPGGTEVALKFIALQSNSGAVELKALRAVKLIRHPNLIAINAIWILDNGGNVLDDATLDRLSSESTHQTIKPNQTLHPDQVGSDTESAFLVIAMAKADKSLEDRLNEAVKDDGHPGIPVGELCEYVNQAAAGLDFLNEQRHFIDGKVRGVIHRDVKPANLLLVGNAVVVGDFGVATTLKDFDATATSLSGSIGFMSPESIARKPSPSTDQYALAISYYWMRTNSLPYAETISIDKLLEIHRTGSLNFDFVDSDERLILQKATSTDPKNRFRNCRELAKALSDLHAGKTSTLEEPKQQSKYLPYAITATLLIVIVGSLFFWPRGKGNGGDKPGPIPIPQRTLTFDPGDAQFEVSYVDEDGKSIVSTASEKIMFRLPDDGMIEVRSVDPAGILQPLEKKQFSVEDLEKMSWSIKLPKKSLDEIREAAMRLVESQDREQAMELLKSAYAEYPEILEVGNQRQKLDIAGKVTHLVSIPDTKRMAISVQNNNERVPQLVTLGKNIHVTMVSGREAGSYIEDLIVDPVSRQLLVLNTFSLESKDVSDETADLTRIWSSKKSNIRLICGAMLSSRSTLAVGDRDGTVHLVKTDGTNSKQEVKIGDEAIIWMIAGESKLFAISEDDSITQIEILEGGGVQKRLIALPFDPSEEEIMEVIKAGSTGIVVATDLHIYHCPSMDEAAPIFTKTSDIGSSSEVLRMKASSDGKRLLVSTVSPEVSFELWDLEQKALTLSNTKNKGERTIATDFEFSPNGKWACVVFSNGTLVSIDIANNKITEFEKSIQKQYTMARFDTESKYLVTMLEKQTDQNSRSASTTEIHVWDFEKCQILYEAKDQLINR